MGRALWHNEISTMNKEKLTSLLHCLVVKRWQIVALASGLAVSLLSFVPNIFIQSTVLVVLIPFFLSVMKIPKKQAYTAGLIFFAVWILPTTYWYYGFMPWWLAVLASVGYVTLIANLFHFMNIKRRTLALMLMCIAWAAFTYVRLRLPVTEDWWLPHLGYAAWSNPAVLWFGKLWGEASIELLILLSNAAIALLIWKRRYLLGFTLGGVLTVGFLLAGLAVTQQSPATPVTLTALQQSVLGGIDTAATDKDVTVLMQKTKDAVKESQKRAGEELNFEGKMKVLEILAERNFRIDFSGGDPLYYDDDFEIVRQAVTLLPPQNISVSMTGSGYIDDERTKILKSVDAIELTLDNVFEYRNPFRPRGYNVSSATMLKKCVDVGINVRAVTTLHQYSIFCQNLEEVYGWLCDNGVQEWSVIKFCPVGRAMKFAQSMPSDNDYLEAVNTLKKFNGYTKIVFQHSLEVLEGRKKCHAAMDFDIQIHYPV
jgi:hypothetical protein